MESSKTQRNHLATSQQKEQGWLSSKPKRDYITMSDLCVWVHGVPFAWTAVSHLSLVKIPPH